MSDRGSTWRMRNRAYGVRVPLDDVQMHLAQGWQFLVDDVREIDTRDGATLLRAPQAGETMR